MTKTLRGLLAIIFSAFIPYTAAWADWYMVGPADFKPKETLVDSTTSWLVFGVRTNKRTGMIAPIHLPIGAQILGFSCQVYDNSSVHSVGAFVMEYSTDDNGSSRGGSFYSASTGVSSLVPGYTKLSDQVPNVANPVIKDWINVTNGASFVGARYFSYFVEISLDGSSDTAARSCAITYTP